ncbi:MAG: hypothetical protein UR56_C0014G0011 [Candidatus Roizmanbacteria bacterium GW2011_GWC2_34_23]|uniref:Uncharacterized protein n=1 Tax=Candidatus Roizmanbacteria bacterium GW2011_GWC2_34_23 TaxID=1618484 RepID=A0A0G0AVZ1_9BACT|nr:MAG: hypothetical protein UR56_C0014G0011 [Candidatus Roizmanbacteria bacterium GW2011_GWC2_34_23]
MFDICYSKYNMLFTFILILSLSFIVALRSMKDFNVPGEITRIVQGKKLKGKIVFFKNKVVHYRAKRS